MGLFFACTSAEIEPKTIVAYGLTFSCRLALFAPFSTLPVPVAACWHCTAPTTELRKTYSEFGHGSNAGHSSGVAGVDARRATPQIRGWRAGGSLAVASSTPATPLFSPAKIPELNHA